MHRFRAVTVGILAAAAIATVPSTAASADP